MNRGKKNIILKITNSGIYYNSKDRIQWKNTNFPSKDLFMFRERNEIYWEVEMLSFDKKSSELEICVIDYNVENKEHVFLLQSPKYPIEKIKFRDLIWSYLERILSSYKRSAFKEIALIDSSKEKEKYKSFDSDLRLTLNQKIEVKTKFPIMKTTFKMGYVELSKKFKGHDEPIKIALYNDHIIPEFDHVKPFFKKALGNKMIDVNGTIVIKVNGEVDVDCHSKAISRINEGVISSVKRLNLRSSILDPKVIPVDKSLFTPDEYFEKTEEQLGNSFRQSDTDIFNEIMELDGIRNKRELIFLSGKLQRKDSRLRFTLSPKFGFLFHVKGEEMDHFVWELLDSHATYIWSIENSPLNLETKLKLLEREINFIRDNGRRAFLGNKVDSDFVFSKVNHAAAGLVDGFPKWKSLVTEKLV